MEVQITREEDIQHPVVYQDGDFSLYVEDCSIGWVLHCYVKNWCLSSYKRGLDVLGELLKIAPNNELFVFSVNKKLSKFSNMLGFESIDDILDREGEKIGELLRCSIQ